MKKLAITLAVPDDALRNTGQGAVYKETYIVEIDNLPQAVIDAIEGKRYCGSVSDISFVKEVANDNPN